MLGQPLRIGEGRGPPNILRQKTIKLGFEARIGFRVLIGLVEFEDQRHQGFGHITPAEGTEMSVGVGSGMVVSLRGRRSR